MRLLYYLNEAENLNDLYDIVDTLKTECRPFLKHRVLLYRGSYDKYENMKLISPHKNRKPKDTPLELHKIWDEEFKKVFGWRARSEGVFCTGDLNQAYDFGNHVYLVFPVGRFKFLWSTEYKDMVDNDYVSDHYMDKKYKNFSKLRYIWEEGGEGLQFEDWLEKYDKRMETEARNMIKTYKNTNLKEAAKSGHEISLKCDEYYVIHPMFGVDIIDML